MNLRSVSISKHAKPIHALLDDLRDGGMGMLLTTHDFEQATSIADRVAFMVMGRVVIEGGVSELINGVFRGAKELVVTLSGTAAPAAEAVLKSYSLRPTRDRRCWSGPLNGGYPELSRIETVAGRRGRAGCGNSAA